MNSQQTSPEITVKFMYRGIYNEESRMGWIRQFPGNEPVWGRCRFSFDPDSKTYDWLVVYHDLPANRGEGTGPTVESLACHRKNTLHVTHEPSSITTYGQAYQAQYGHVLTSQEPSCVRHPNRIYTHPGFPWYYGRSFSGKPFLSYDQIASAQPKAKTKLLSTVCSAKQQKHTVHQQRYDFTQKIKAAIPELEIFGHGVQPIDDKAETLDDYKYHLAIENHFSPHHWTEKLSDPFLGHCLPIYAGAPNASEYVPEDSFVPIDLHDVDSAIKIIKNLLKEDPYEQRLPTILQARKRMLEEHNLFSILSRNIEQLHQPLPLSGETILCRKAFWKKHPLARIQCVIEKTYRVLSGRFSR